MAKQKTCMLDFLIGDVLCRLSTVAVEYQEDPEVRYYQHSHTFFEIHYVTQGEFSCKAGEQKFHVPEGQLLLIEPGVYHSIKEISPVASKMCIGFEIYRPDGEEPNPEDLAFAEVFFQAKSAVMDLKKTGNGSGIANILCRIREISRQTMLVMTDREELKYLAALLLLKLHGDLTQHVRQGESKGAGSKEQKDYRIDEFFNQNFQRNDGNELLAKQLCVSTRQLDRILQRTYGMGYQRKLIEIRLEIAVDMLRTTQKSISEISELLGYSSPSSFSAFIKRETNQSPSQIREGL